MKNVKLRVPQTAIELRRSFEIIGSKLGIQKQEDWYSCASKQLLEENGISNESLSTSLATAYPEFEWHPFLFSKVPHGFWNNISNHRKMLDWIGNQLQIERQEDWYLKTGKDIIGIAGTQLLTHYNFSIIKLLQTVYSEFQWNPLFFQGVPHYHWQNHDNQRKLLDWIADQWGIQRQEDWYKYSSLDLQKEGGAGLLKQYNKSLLRTLQSVYPEFEWHSILFSQVPNHFWDEKRNQRQFFDWIAWQLGVETQPDWYNVTIKDVQNVGGSRLLRLHNNSLIKTLQAVYGEYTWNTTTTVDWREVCDSLSESFGIQYQEDWYKIQNVHLLNHGRSGVLKKFGYSVYKLVSTAYPEYDWNSLKFQSQKNTWHKLQHQREFLDTVALQYDITQQADWYLLSRREIKQSGGAALLHQYHGSFIKAISHIYPEFEWNPLLFRKVPRHHWTDRSNQRKFLDWIADQLGFRKPHDWFAVSPRKLRSFGVMNVFRLHGGLLNTLQNIYPECDWAAIQHSSQGQHQLTSLIQKLVPYEVKVEHKLRSEETDLYVELDVYIPELSLALEYQGRQHYIDVGSGAFGQLSKQRIRDEEKKNICQQLGITLIEIPFWWDCNIHSLATTIKKHRPDVQLRVSGVEASYEEKNPL